MKNNISDIFFNTVSISALRGGLFLSIFLISQQSSLAQFGQISAIYVFVVSGAQIIGYCLSTVALDLSVESQHKKNNISLISIKYYLIDIEYLNISFFTMQHSSADNIDFFQNRLVVVIEV